MYCTKVREERDADSRGPIESDRAGLSETTGKVWLRLNSGKVKVKRGYIHMAPEGTQDFIVFCPDPRWIEIKAPGQRTKKERAEKQQQAAERVIALGHRHLRATTLDEVIEFVQ